MARVTVDKNYFQFTQGKITEASPLSFPENSMKDELNIDINFDGTIQRRKGIDYEPGYTLFGTSFQKVSSSTNPGGPLAQIYKWENVGGYPKETPILVVRYGTHLVFYESLEEPLSSAMVGSMMEVGASESIISDSFLGFAEAKGYLFVVGQGFDPLYIKYNPTTNNFEKTSVTIKIRDLDGLPENIEDHIRPSTLTGIHRYNLLNQGWPFRRVINKNIVGGTRPVGYDDSPLAFLRDPVRGYPSNSDLYRSYTESGDEKGDMVEAWIRSVPISTSRAPRGKVIIEAFRENRKELAQEYSAKTTPVTPWVPPNYEERSTTSRPTCVTFFQGHVMFSGVNDLDYNDKIYVSQSLVDISRAGRAYSVNDPTSGIESSPLDTDGGVIRIEGVDRILSLQAIGGHLLVIGNNGLWSIRGTEGGFSVNDIVLNKLSSVGGISASSVVNYEGTVLFWSDSGIYAVTLDSQFDTLSVANITEETIQRDYVAIPEGKKKYANPIVDTLNRKIYWLYNNDATDPINCRMNRVLVLDMRTSSFFDYEFPVDENDEYPFVVAGFSKPRIGIFESTELVTVDGVTVTVNSEDVTVTSSVSISTGIGNAIKYLTFKGEDNNWRVLFSELYNTKFVDWASDVEGGVDYVSFVETGYELMDDSMRDMQATYIFTYFNRTEQGFVEVDEPDKSALCSALDAAGDLEAENYTPESWQDLVDAVTAGQAVKDDPDATQFEVDAAVSAITEAINALVPAEPPSSATFTYAGDGWEYIMQGAVDSRPGSGVDGSFHSWRGVVPSENLNLVSYPNLGPMNRQQFEQSIADFRSIILSHSGYGVGDSTGVSVEWDDSTPTTYSDNEVVLENRFSSFGGVYDTLDDALAAKEPFLVITPVTFLCSGSSSPEDIGEYRNILSSWPVYSTARCYVNLPAIAVNVDYGED